MAQITPKSKVWAYQNEYVIKGWKPSRIQREHPELSIHTLNTYRSMYHWREMRKAYLQANGIVEEDRDPKQKAKLRGAKWRKFQDKIVERLDKLDPNDDKFEYKLNILVGAYDRATKGERLEDDQPTVVEKKVQWGQDETAGQLGDIMDSIKLTKIDKLEVHNHGVPSLPEHGNTIDGEVYSSDSGSEGGKDNNGSSEAVNVDG